MGIMQLWDFSESKSELQTIGIIPGLASNVTHGYLRMLAFGNGTIGITPVLAPAPHNDIFGCWRLAMEPMVLPGTRGILWAQGCFRMSADSPMTNGI
jgi:hypothetical protein